MVALYDQPKRSSLKCHYDKEKSPMTESQTIEYKQSWRDEYIKWISGFANAQGGVLIIGKDDNGKTVGIDNLKKFMEDIPNKVRDILGIIVEVNLREDNSKYYLEIVVQKYPYPISFKGQYYLRSGSTKQELTGAALDSFLLRKQGRHWDGVPVPGISVKNLSKEVLRYFRNEALKSNRLTKDIIEQNDLHLLEKLQLVEGNYLKRAAVLLFGTEPEMFVPGAFIKIGRFKSNSDLLFQNEIHGSLFEQIEKTIDLLLTKYLVAEISYEGIHRRETLPYPEEGLREAILNAVAHKDYGCHTPIQISVHDNQLYIWNEGRLPENWTIDDLLKKHGSRLYNPLIANTFFRAGLVEAWGRGIEKVIKECVAYKCPKPAFDYRQSGLMVKFRARPSKAKTSEQSQVIGGTTTQETTQEKILSLISEQPTITRKKISEVIGLSSDGVKYHLTKLTAANRIRHVGPTKAGHWEILITGKDN